MATTEETASLWDLFGDISKSFNEEYKNEKSNIESDTKYMEDDCEKCGTIGSLIAQDGAMVCIMCGSENDINIDIGQEWRYYGDDGGKGGDPTRVGMPTNTLITSSAPTTIMLGWGNEGFRRQQKWGSSTHRERTLNDIFHKLKEKCLKSGLPQCVVDKAIVMYQKCDSTRRAKCRTGVLAACIMYACHAKDISRSEEEIEDIFDIDRKKLSSGFKDVHSYLYNFNPEYICMIEPCSPENDITRYCNLLGIRNEYIEVAKKVYKNADFFGLISNITQKSITLGCIYMIIKYYNLDIELEELIKINSNKRRSCILSSAIEKSYLKLMEYQDYLIL